MTNSKTYVTGHGLELDEPVQIVGVPISLSHGMKIKDCPCYIEGTLLEVG